MNPDMDGLIGIRRLAIDLLSGPSVPNCGFQPSGDWDNLWVHNFVIAADVMFSELVLEYRCGTGLPRDAHAARTFPSGLRGGEIF